MRDIKVKEPVRNIKVLDKAAVVGEHSVNAADRIRTRTSGFSSGEEGSAHEYAQENMQRTLGDSISDAGHDLADGTKAGIKAGISRGKKEYQRHKERGVERGVDPPGQERGVSVQGRQGNEAPSTSYQKGKTYAQEKAKQSYRIKGKTQGVSTSSRAKHSVDAGGTNALKTAKGSIKKAGKSVKTTKQTSQAAVQGTSRAAAAAKQSAIAAARTSRATAQVSQSTARISSVIARKVAHAASVAVKGVLAGTKVLLSALVAGGTVAVMTVVVLCVVGLIAGSFFGIFFSNADAGDAMTLQQVVREINQEYQDELDHIKTSVAHDVLEMSGSRAVWPEVLSVYSVKTTTDPEHPQEVATMTEDKKRLLEDIFWEMNQIDHRTESKTETEVVETDDGNGNILEEEVSVTNIYLHITVSHKTAEEMVQAYHFDQEQKEMMVELLDEENASLWTSVLYGIGASDEQIVAVALSQVGNVGGEPYWSWYGFSSHVEWCACFVSWCANECGYIENGIIPKFAGCVGGINWFKERGQWADNSIEPTPGMLIFFDWDDPDGLSGPQDGLSDHVGIVEKVEGGRVYTIEGNSGDACRQRSYPVGYYEIMGYGMPAY